MKHIVALSLICASLFSNAQTYGPSATFGTNGEVRQDVANGVDLANAHSLLPDGKLLIVGDGLDNGINSFHVSLMRIDTICGALDTTFGNGGTVAHTHLQRTQCFDIALQPDGKIVGCGMIAPSNSGSQQKAGVFRFNADGSVDSTFHGTGFHQAFWDPTSSGRLWRPFVNADSSITCAGTSLGNINGGSNAMGAMRFTNAGDFDLSFSGDGIVTTSIAVNSSGTGAMRPDGRLLLVGSTSTNNIAMAQFNTDGSLDATFGNGGTIITPVLSTTGLPGGFGASILPDGRILFSGPGVTGGFLMARFLEDGIVDSTYATNGISDIPAISAPGYDHELLADGSSLQFGGSGATCNVLKRDANGQVLTGFGSNGFVIAGTGGADAFMGGFTLPSERIIGYGGASSDRMFAVRLTTDPLADALPNISLVGTELVTTGTGPLQWYLDGNSLPGETNSTHVPLQNGVYTVTMTLSSDCVFTSDPFNMLSVGMDESNANGSIQLYPIPASDRLSISGLIATEGMMATAIDAAGRRIALAWSDRSTLDIAALAGGTYALEITDRDRMIRSRFIKN